MADKKDLSREELKKASGGQSADRPRPDKTTADLAGKAVADVLTNADLSGAKGGTAADRARPAGKPIGDVLTDADLAGTQGGTAADRARPDKSKVDPYIKPNADVVVPDADKAGR